MIGFVRARFLLPLSDALGRDRRVEDGYVLWRDDEILELGAFDDGVGARIVAAHGPRLPVIGARAEGVASTPRGVRLAVLGCVLAVLGFFSWQFRYSTLSDQRQQLATERKKLDKQEKQLKQREKDWIDLLQKKEVLDEQLKKNRITLPASSELPAFFMHLQKPAAAAGVSSVAAQRVRSSAVDTHVRVPGSTDRTGP